MTDLRFKIESALVLVAGILIALSAAYVGYLINF